MSKVKENAIKEAKRIEEDVLYTAKSNFIVGLKWNSRHYWIGIPATILAAIAGCSAISEYESAKLVAGILSVIVAVLTGLATFLNPQERASLYKSTGNNYNSLRGKARLFYEAEVELCKDDKEIVSIVKSLSDQRDKLNKTCPHIPKWAFEKARKGIEEGEAKYLADCES